MMLGQALAYDGQTDLALEALADAMRLSGGNSKPTSLRGYLLARTGRVAEAREIPPAPGGAIQGALRAALRVRARPRRV